MRLFLPSARATNWLLIVGFSALGYALYMRYVAIENTQTGLACAAGLDTWLCRSRHVVIALYQHSAFGGAALVVAAVNFLRPTLLVFAAAVALTALAVVLYNVGLGGVAAALLVLTLARCAPETA
jgi:hypothetical protein